MLTLFFLGIQTVLDQNDQIIKELENVKVKVENVNLKIENLKKQVSEDMSELGNVLKGIVENDKADVENVKEEVEHVKLQVKDFKNQFSSDMSKLVKVLEMMKTDSKDISSKKDISETARVDLFPCFRDIKNSFYLDETPVDKKAVDKAVVTASSNMDSYLLHVDVYAGDAGVGFYTPEGRYNIKWERAGYRSYNCHHISSAVVCKCVRSTEVQSSCNKEVGY